MRKCLAILLALTLLGTACDSPVESVARYEPLLPLRLLLVSYGPSDLWLEILESGSQRSLGSRIPGSAKMVENEIVVALENRIEPPTGYAPDGFGPAEFWASLPVEEGIYDLSVSFGGRMDRYQLIIEEGSYRFSGLHGSFTTYPGTAKPRG